MGQQLLGSVFGQQPNALPYQVELIGVPFGIVGDLGRPGSDLGFCNPGGRNRVSTQEFGNVAAAVIAGDTAHFLKKGRHAFGVVAGTRKGSDPDAVSLVLISPGEVDHHLLHQALGPDDRRGYTIAFTAGRHRRSQHQQHHGDGHFLGALHSARQVALGHVGNFMAHNTGQFSFVFRQQHQPAVDRNDTTGRCEGVDRLVVYQQEMEVAAGFVAVGGQAKAQVPDIAFHQRIVDDVGQAVEFPHQSLAVSPFVLLGHDGARRCPDIRQLDVLGAGPRGADQQQ